MQAFIDGQIGPNLQAHEAMHEDDKKQDTWISLSIIIGPKLDSLVFSYCMFYLG